MTRKSTLFGNESGASAAEFALVLPVFLMFLVGMIDVGRYTWAFNEAEKATQIGARWAVATDPVPSALSSYSFVIDGGLEQGQPVPIASFAGIHCESSSAQVSCNCLGNSCPPNFDPSPGDAGQAAFDLMVARMRTIYPRVSPDNITIDYLHSGLGFAGDPNGPDVAPIIRVAMTDQTFPLFLMLGTEVPLPSFTYELTMEDGAGTFSNY